MFHLTGVLVLLLVSLLVDRCMFGEVSVATVCFI